ncbi:hypothetical protein D9M68_998670 [compost metagenome]
MGYRTNIRADLLLAFGAHIGSDERLHRTFILAHPENQRFQSQLVQRPFDKGGFA